MSVLVDKVADVAMAFSKMKCINFLQQESGSNKAYKLGMLDERSVVDLHICHRQSLVCLLMRAMAYLVCYTDCPNFIKDHINQDLCLILKMFNY